MLVADELSGFSPLNGTAELSTSPQSWLAGIVSSWVGVAGEEFSPEKLTAETARFQALGFVAGLGERLRPSQGGQAEAISIVEQFRSSSGARAEVASELRQAGSRGKSTFAVAGIPGSRGFGSSTALNVAFTLGAYYYLVGVGVPSPGTPGLTTRAQLVGAAESLYRRVRG